MEEWQATIEAAKARADADKMLPLASIWQSAHDAWTPDAQDEPANYPYYRRGIAGRAVMEALGVNWRDSGIDTILHYAMCESTDYATWRASFIARAKGFQLPEKAYHRISYRSAPSNDAYAIEKEARSIFETSFRNRFHGKRINSKFAQEKWNEVRAKAMEIASARIAADVADYQKHLAEISAENKARQNAYDDAVSHIVKIQEIAAKL